MTISTVAKGLALALVVAGQGMAALAGTMPPIMLTKELGYMEARADMFRSTHDDARKESPNGFYAASGDFDGDGRTDEARILIHRDGKSGMLVIVLNRVGYKMKTFGFESMKAATLGNIGIKVAPAGTYQLAKPVGGMTTKTIGSDAVMLFRFGGMARLYTFADDDFVSTDIIPG